MGDTSLFYYQDQLLKVNPRVLRLEYNITGAKTCAPIVSNSASMVFYDALSTQAQVDDFLGTEDEFLYTAFGSTAMGTDAFAGLVNMGGANGQAKLVTQIVVKSFTGSNGATQVIVQSQAAAMANTLLTKVEAGDYGNIAFQAVVAGLDALTSGTIVVEIHWIPK